MSAHLWRVVARVVDGLDLVAYTAQAVAVGPAVSLRPGEGVVMEVEA